MTLARLHLDENFSFDTTQRLRGYGHDCVTAFGLGLAGASDATHLLRAAQDNRVFITHNGDDFELLHEAWMQWFAAYGVQPAPSHAGILIVPQPNPKLKFWLPDFAAHEIDSFLSQGLPLTNMVYKWTVSSGWQSV